MIPPAFSRGLFRTQARPLPATVAGDTIELRPVESALGGNLGFRGIKQTQIVVGGCLLDATITASVTLDGTKELHGRADLEKPRERAQGLEASPRMIPPAFSRGLFRTQAKPLPATVARVQLSLYPTEKNLGGNLGYRVTARTQIVVGGCLLDATITATVTLDGTKELHGPAALDLNGPATLEKPRSVPLAEDSQSAAPVELHPPVRAESVQSHLNTTARLHGPATLEKPRSVPPAEGAKNKAGVIFLVVILCVGLYGKFNAPPKPAYSPAAYSAPVPPPVWVDGYYRRDGTYVRGHYRTAPDETDLNNWSTNPNVNPFTGQQGTRTHR